MKPVFVKGIGRDAQEPALTTSIREVLLESSDSFSWLDKGDTVLLKPALNSPDPYPATTHPLALEVTSKLLAEHGAKVVIGDQSGIEYLLHHPGGVIRGSSLSNYIRSGNGIKRRYPVFASFEDGGGTLVFITTDPGTHLRGHMVFSCRNGHGKPTILSAFPV